MSPSEVVDRLVNHRTLGSVPRAELEWLASNGTIRELVPGGVLGVKSAPVDHMFIVLSGHFAMHVDRGSGLQKIMEWHGGDVTGLLPYSRLVSPPADSVAQEPSTVLAIHRELFPALVSNCHE